MPQVADIRGLWRRSLIEWPDGRRDITSEVLWLQGISAFGDLRRPTPMADFSHAHRLSDLSRQDCAALAQQQGFAGHLTFDGRHFEWTRMIDFQPKSRVDAGSLRWQSGVLIEEGRDADYIEHWHRDAVAMPGPAAAAVLHNTILGIKAVFVRVGQYYIFARDRTIELPVECSLAECVAAAPNLEQARALVDCEISFGSATSDGLRITASTLPYRVGKLLHLSLDHAWEILDGEGDLAALRGFAKL
jgi:hypothetical protein